MFGEDYAIQISSKNGTELSQQQSLALNKQVEKLLQEKEIKFKAIDKQKAGLLVRMLDPEEQLLARTWIKDKMYRN